MPVDSISQINAATSRTKKQMQLIFLPILDAANRQIDFATGDAVWRRDRIKSGGKFTLASAGFSLYDKEQQPASSLCWRVGGRSVTNPASTIMSDGVVKTRGGGRAWVVRGGGG